MPEKRDDNMKTAGRYEVLPLLSTAPNEDVIMGGVIASTHQTRHINTEEHDLDIIVLSDDEYEHESEKPAKATSRSLEYEWRKTKAEVGSKKEDREVEKLLLESKLRSALASSDSKPPPTVLDNRHEGELKLKVSTSDIEYYEKMMGSADLHLSYIRQGYEVSENLLAIRGAKSQIQKA